MQNSIPTLNNVPACYANISTVWFAHNFIEGVSVHPARFKRTDYRLLHQLRTTIHMEEKKTEAVCDTLVFVAHRLDCVQHNGIHCVYVNEANREHRNEKDKTMKTATMQTKTETELHTNRESEQCDGCTRCSILIAVCMCM